MFKGRVEKVSHEGGLLVSYSGACPALGSVMIDSNETYVEQSGWSNRKFAGFH